MLMFGGRRVKIELGNGKEVRDHVEVSHVSDLLVRGLECWKLLKKSFS
jgi:hypothetical protein